MSPWWCCSGINPEDSTSTTRAHPMTSSASANANAAVGPECLSAKLSCRTDDATHDRRATRRHREVLRTGVAAAARRPSLLGTPGIPRNNAHAVATGPFTNARSDAPLPPYAAARAPRRARACRRCKAGRADRRAHGACGQRFSGSRCSASIASSLIEDAMKVARSLAAVPVVSHQSKAHWYTQRSAPPTSSQS